MLAIPLRLYQTGSKYPGRSLILLVCVTPELQWTHRYFPQGAYMIFDRYFSLMNALHVDWLSRRQLFSLIMDSTALERMAAHVHHDSVTPFHLVVDRLCS